MSDTVRSFEVDGHRYELTLMGENDRIVLSSANPAAKVRDPRIKRRVRRSLVGSGISYDACWNQLRSGGQGEVRLATFYVGARLAGAKRSAKELLDMVQKALMKALLVDPFPAVEPATV